MASILSSIAAGLSRLSAIICARVAASDDFERVGFDTRDRSGRDRGGRLAVESEFRACAVRLHHWGFGGARIEGHDMDAFALQLAAQGLTEPGKTRLCRCVGGVERRTDQCDSRGHVNNHRLAACTQRRHGRPISRIGARRSTVSIASISASVVTSSLPARTPPALLTRISTPRGHRAHPARSRRALPLCRHPWQSR